MERRQFLKGLLIGGVSFVLNSIPGIGKHIFATSLKETKIGIFGPSHCCVPAVYAKEKGFFKKEGINVTLQNYRTMLELMQNFLAGNIFAGQIVGPMVFDAHLGIEPFKSPVKMVVPAVLGIHGSNIMVAKHSNVNQPIDFKNKSIASHSKLSIHYLLSKYFLMKNGVDPDKDAEVKIVSLLEVEEYVDKKEVDAFMMPEPVNAMIESKGKASIVMFN